MKENIPYIRRPTASKFLGKVTKEKSKLGKIKNTDL